MAAVKQQTNTSVTPSYHISDAHGNGVHLTQQDANLKIIIGGAIFQLTQQNVTDLLPVLTVFSNSGRLS